MVSTDLDAQAEPLTELTAQLSQINLNVDFPAATFTLSVPTDVIPVTLEDLRRVGPLEAPPDPK